MFLFSIQFSDLFSKYIFFMKMSHKLFKSEGGIRLKAKRNENKDR